MNNKSLIDHFLNNNFMKYKLLLMTLFACGLGWGQIIISQVYEGASNNKWVEITNVGNSSVDLTTPVQYKFGLWSVTGDAGNGSISGTPTSSISLTGSLSVGAKFLIRNTGSSTAVPHNPMPSGDNSNTTVAGYNGNDAIAIFTGTNTIVDAFGHGINNKDISYHRNSNVLSANASFTISEWTSKSLTEVANANSSVSEYIGTHIYNSSISTTTYTTSWSNSAPTASIDAIIDGDLTTSGNLTCKDLTINSGKTLTIGAGNKLTVSGNLINNGTIVFKSTATGTAMFDVFNGIQSGTGVVTVERFIPSGKRAFRLLSPAVTTTAFISGNWQLATHITGGASGGFDATETNNPSMFTYDNQAAQGVSGWTPIANTNATNLTAGVGYRVLIRGDRTSTNITAASADSMNAAITLSATGTLRTGTVTLNSSSTPSINNTTNSVTNGYSLVGNPYQSAVDWHAVTKSGIEATYWAWDPNMGTPGVQRGRYVSYNVSSGSSDNGSQVGQFIQPSQAFFVKNTVTGIAGSLTFEEAHKATTSANVFRNANQTESANLTSLSVQLYDPNELAIGAYPIDATKAVFSSEYTNELGLGDAAKLEAAGENIAWFRNNTKLAIDAAAPVTTSDELAMKTLRLGANKNYTFKIQTTNFDADLTPYLVDNFLNTQTAISTSEAYLANFSTTSNVASYGEDRFKIVFQTSALSTDDFANNIKLFPNPAKAGASFYIDGITEATVSVYNVVGQNIPVSVMSQGNAVQVTPNTALSQGVYLVTVTTAGKTAQVKWIVE